jgi:hypothetical protein
MTDNNARGTLLLKNSRKSLQSFPCSLLADNPRLHHSTLSYSQCRERR